jgi:hypothetical protein
MLPHFNLCPVKTAKTAFETFHTPVNHCEIWIGTLLHDRAPEYKFKCHKNVTSIHQAPQKIKKVTDGSWSLATLAQLLTRLQKKKSKYDTCSMHSHCAKCTVTAQNYLGKNPSQNWINVGASWKLAVSRNPAHFFDQFWNSVVMGKKLDVTIFEIDIHFLFVTSGLDKIYGPRNI